MGIPERTTPDLFFFDDFESSIRPTKYLAGFGMWEPLEDSRTSHHGSYCLESLPDGTDPGVSGSNDLTLYKNVLDIDKDYALSFMVKGSNAGTLKVCAQSGSKTYELLTQIVDTDAWQEVTVDLSGYAGRTVDIYIMQYYESDNPCPMYIDCLGLWYKYAHTYSDGRKLAWSESFEDEEMPSGWNIIDKDSDGYTWNLNYKDDEIKKRHGIGSVYSESSLSLFGDALTTNNWLILPNKTLESDKKYVLTFEAAEDWSGYSEKFGVYISTDNGESFTQIGDDYTTTDKWQEIEVDLSAYSGKTVTIAVVHHNCTDQYRLVLDCFNLWEYSLTATISSFEVTSSNVIVYYTVTDSTEVKSQTYAFSEITEDMVDLMKSKNIQHVIDFVNYSTDGSDTVILTPAQLKAIEYVLEYDLGIAA